MPIYGGTLTWVNNVPRSFDGHQDIGFGPAAQLPTFNQLVQFNLDYKETVPENVIGDLAESWEVSPDGTEITFKLHQGVKWHDGMPFTAEDVVYSLDRMADVIRSKIANRIPAYQSSEAIDDHTVKVYLKHPSASFLVGLATGDASIQAKHLEGTDPQSADFMVGTGPWILTDFIVRVHLKWKKNPDYFKKDKYGNQLPYLDNLYLIQMTEAGGDEAFIARRLDVSGPMMGPNTIDRYELVKAGAPGALWQMKIMNYGTSIQLNLEHPPLDDIRVRRALGLVLDQESLVTGYAGDPSFGRKDVGILASGLPPEEIRKLMGWDKPYSERVAEAQKLMAEAGYSDGFPMFFLSSGIAQASTGYAGVSMVFGDLLRRHLKIDATVRQIPGAGSIQLLDEGGYDAYTNVIAVGEDPAFLATYFGSGVYNNRSHYSNPELDKMLTELDRIIDPEKRQEAIWAIERLLLTDLPALPTGAFPVRMMPRYPHMKNIRYTYTSYANNCRAEDIWIDESLRLK